VSRMTLEERAGMMPIGTLNAPVAPHIISGT
jgi:hypothetical protein